MILGQKATFPTRILRDVVWASTSNYLLSGGWQHAVVFSVLYGCRAAVKYHGQAGFQGWERACPARSGKFCLQPVQPCSARVRAQLSEADPLSQHKLDTHDLIERDMGKKTEISTPLWPVVRESEILASVLRAPRAQLGFRGGGGRSLLPRQPGRALAGWIPVK